MLIRKILFACTGLIVVCMMALSGCDCSNSNSSSGSSLKTAPGVDVANKTITLGILSPYSGPVAAPVGDPLTRGVEVYFKHVNDNGGINGYKGKIFLEEKQDNPQKEVEKEKQNHNQGLLIASSLGPPPPPAPQNKNTSK